MFFVDVAKMTKVKYILIYFPPFSSDFVHYFLHSTRENIPQPKNLVIYLFHFFISVLFVIPIEIALFSMHNDDSKCNFYLFVKAYNMRDDDMKMKKEHHKIVIKLGYVVVYSTSFAS